MGEEGMEKPKGPFFMGGMGTTLLFFPVHLLQIEIYARCAFLGVWGFFSRMKIPQANEIPRDHIHYAVRINTPIKSTRIWLE